MGASDYQRSEVWARWRDGIDVRMEPMGILTNLEIQSTREKSAGSQRGKVVSTQEIVSRQ